MKRIAHRGLHDRPDRPPNSRPAVQAALESSADGIEVDLRLLGDGHFVLHHDPLLESTTGDLEGSTRLLAGMTLEEFRGAFDHERLTLEEFLALPARGKTRVLECKRHPNRVSFARHLLGVLPAFDPVSSPVLSSSDGSLLDALRRRSNHSLAPVVYRLDPLVTSRIRRGGWAELHLHESLCDPGTLDALEPHSEKDVVAWTVNDSSTAQRLETMGIKGIMTDVSGLLED